MPINSTQPVPIGAVPAKFLSFVAQPVRSFRSDFLGTRLFLAHGAVSGLFGMGAIASLVSLFEKIRVLTSREIRNYHRFSYVVFVQSRQSRNQK